MKLKASNGYLKSPSSLVDLCQRILDPSVCVFILSLINLGNPVRSTQGHLVTLVLIYLLIMTVFNSFNLYRSWRGASILSEIKNVGAAWFVVQGILLFLNTFIDLPAIEQGRNYALWVIASFAGLTAIRIAVRLTLQWLRHRGTNIRKFVIAGAGDLGLQLRDRIQNSPQFGLVFEGFFDDNAALSDSLDGKLLGSLGDIADFVTSGHIDTVYVALPMRSEKRMLEVVSSLRDLPVMVCLVPDIFVFELMHTRIDDIGGIPVFALFGTPFVGIQAVLKRLQDMVLASIILVLISPAMLAIAVAVKLTSKGPVLFKQRRYGLFGEEIKVLKFRSMNVCEDGDKIAPAKRNDPRVTPLGKFLRRTSLDELPQFINVLQGNMSIVGPRPHPPSYNDYYRKLIKGYVLRHRVKPGITGWAQINGWRGEADTLVKMEKRVEFDIDYIRNWSLWLDLKIIFVTIFKGFIGHNAF